MNIDLTRLLKSYTDELTFRDVITFDKNYLDLTEIRELKPVNVIGSIKKTMEGLCSLEIKADGVMILPCSITLEDVEHPFNIEIYEVLNDNEQNDEEYIKINEYSIDILPIIWQNIVMEIPLKVVKPGLDRKKISGDGWELIIEEENGIEKY